MDPAQMQRRMGNRAASSLMEMRAAPVRPGPSEPEMPVEIAGVTAPAEPAPAGPAPAGPAPAGPAPAEPAPLIVTPPAREIAPDTVRASSEVSSQAMQPEQPAVAVAVPEVVVESPPVEAIADESAISVAPPALVVAGEVMGEVAPTETEETGDAETTGPGGAATGADTGDGAVPPASDVEAATAPVDAVEDQPAGGELETDAAAAEEEVAEAAAPSPREAIAPAARAVGARAGAAQVHSPAAEAAGAAQVAAIEPGVEQRRSAATGTVGQLDAAEPGDVDRVSFKEQLKAKLKEAVPTPTSEAEAKRLMSDGAANTSAQLQAAVGTQTTAAAGPVAIAASPDNEILPESQLAEPAVPLVTEAVGEPPASVSPASVVPDPLPPESVDYSSHSNDADTLMAENQITTGQLARGQEPQFDATLATRTTAEADDVQAPATFRESEAGTRQQTRGRASEALGAGLGDIHGTREGRVTAAATQQTTTQSSDAAERTRVTGDIERIKTATREAVEQILTDMETEATRIFEAGLKEAETAYEDVFEDEKGGFFSWLGGSITGSWDETVARAFRKARTAYENVVNRVIDAVATYVEKKLAEAKTRVTEGRTEVDTYVDDLDSSVASFGEEARTSIGEDFDSMVGDIDSRRDGLVDSLAQKYGESQRRVSEMEERLRSENKSLWDAVYDATIGVVEKIIEFKNMLLSLLARAAAVVGAIIDDPIGFLGNLISGIKAGLDAFVGNIGKHLKDGLMGWLFGALEGAGLTLPTTFDLKGILDLVLQVLGLTKENVRKRAVRLLGEPLVTRLEQVAEIFMVLATEGPAGLWRMLVEKLGDVKEMILGEIQSWVITRVIVAGVKWLVSLLNPASAFIKACMMIYDIVKFFIERGSQIIAVVNAIIGALGAIVGGNIKAMASAVEGALAKILPVAISFLAALLGLGGISEKIREIIGKIQEPINKAIDWVIQKAVALAQKVGSLFGGNKEDDKVDDADPEKAAKVQAALFAIDQAEQRASGEGVSEEEAEGLANQVKRDHPVITAIRVEPGEGVWRYFYKASAEQSKDGAEPAQSVLLTEQDLAPLASYRPGFKPSLKEELSSPAGPYADSHQDGGSNVQPGLDRRHIQAYERIRESLLSEFEGATFAEAAITLNNYGRAPKHETVESIITNAKRVLSDKNSDYVNLWVGDAAENQQRGSDISALTRVLLRKNAERSEAAQSNHPTQALDAEIQDLEQRLEDARYDPEI